MRKFTAHLIILLLIIGSPVAAILLKPINKNFAFFYVKDDCYSHGMWIENRIKNTSDTIDWVFIGSSHTIHSVVDYRLQDSIKAKSGVNVNIASFGYCRYGPDIWYVLLNDLLKYQRPKRLFVEVNWRFEGDNASHIDFGYTADWKDILQVPFNSDTGYFNNIKKAILVRIESCKNTFLHAYTIPQPDNDKWGYIPDVIGIEDEKVLNGRVNEMNNILKQTDVNNNIKQNNSAVIYYQRMFALADRYKIPITFYYVPIYSGPQHPIDMGFFSSKGELLLPPPYIGANKTNWMDPYHLNNNGAYQYTDWLTGKCIPFLIKK